MNPTVRIHIDELVLHGVAPSDRARVAARLSDELARLVAERGVPAGWRQGAVADRLDAGQVSAAPGDADFGGHVAGAVFRRLVDVAPQSATGMPS